jgi:hypothetical protein
MIFLTRRAGGVDSKGQGVNDVRRHGFDIPMVFKEPKHLGSWHGFC